MGITRADYDALEAKRREREAGERRPETGALHRAALSVRQVTGDEHWDEFLSILNSRLEDARNAVSGAENALRHSNDFDTDTLINQKLTVRLLGREAEVLEWVIGLPKEILDKGADASKLLASTE